MSKKKPFAFVLMPFDKSFDDIYRLGIQQTAEEEGIIAERVDEQIYSDTILERIYRQITDCDFLIADMTGKNPNVFYEVGYAHAQKKLCTLITNNSDDIPFDLKHHRHLVYGGSITTLKSMLRDEFIWVKQEIDRFATETFDITLTHSGGMLIKEEWKIDGSIEITIDIINKSSKRSQELDSIYVYSNKEWVFFHRGVECNYTDEAIQKKMRRHFIKPDLSRLSPGAWTQIKLTGRRNFWIRYMGEEKKESYSSKGVIPIEINTSEGVFKKDFNVEADFDEIPF